MPFTSLFSRLSFFAKNSLDANRAAGSQKTRLFVLAVSALVLSQAALASDITVASPVSGTTVPSPLLVKAHNVGCNGLPPRSFGFSVDNSTGITMGATAYDINATSVSMSAGYHTIHFKSWTSAGVCPVVDSKITVSSSATAPSSGYIPSYATVTADLDGFTNWQAEHDAGTPGSSSGSSVYPTTTPSYDDARKFYMTYSSHGGERWHLSFGKNSSVTHFVYDTYIYLTDPSQVQNLELDLNQVMPNGWTAIFGTQCSSVSGTWEYSYTANGGPHWHASNIGCNPRNWAANTWHHVQIAVHRDSTGVVTHDWVNLDGTHTDFSNAVGTSALSLGWASADLLTNFQIDGYNSTSGTITTYVHKMVVYTW